PNFKLALSLSGTSAQAGSDVAATANAMYLFGAPLQGGTAHAYVTRELATVQPQGWDEYWFGRQWFYPEQTPSFDTDVFQRDLALDAQGNASLSVSVPRDLPFPMTYTVDMEATDVSNLSVSDSKSFLALPGDGVIGISSDAGGVAGKPLTLHVIVTDAAGHAIAGRGVHLTLQKMTYTSATQEVEGGESAQQSIEYTDAGSTDVTSGQAAVDAQLTPSDPGPYRVVANFAGAQGDATSTDYQVFAFGPGEADWGLSDPNAVAVKLDKKSYSPGDTATAMVASPYANSDVYVSVVRGDTLYRTTLRGVNGAGRVSFRITPQMLPNAAFEAVVVRRGANIASAKPGSVAGLARVGMASFEVSVADRYLKLGIVPQSAKVQPGGSQHVDFALTHKDGSAARGEVVAMVVNDAILQLSGYRPPDLVQTVFADQPISTIFSDNREGIVLQTQTPPPEKGFGYGGGFLTGAGSTRVRQHFLPLAYYRVLQTDSSGKAGVTFSMPDDLTTWRVMAVAVADDDAHFVTSDATFISALPLMTNPLLPQFARPGDSFGLGVSASNQTGVNGALDLVMQLTGALAFTSGDPHRMQISEQAANGMQAWRFPVNVGTPVPTTVEATGRLGTQSDAFKVPFGVIDRGSTDAVIETGATASHASIPIDLNRGGYLQLTLANSIVPQFVVPSQQMMNADPYPFADELSSRLEIASALQSLRQPYR
ncbi:MAG TPA: alpha-2-macroglobulin family protein, partial [Candidatus Baltobacteraceae bacterium]|nr:alpha-2-macroglobulin family protein [Candidatus Baltobacteraceae bacterium]